MIRLMIFIFGGSDRDTSGQLCPSAHIKHAGRTTIGLSWPGSVRCRISPLRCNRITVHKSGFGMRQPHSVCVLADGDALVSDLDMAMLHCVQRVVLVGCIEPALLGYGAARRFAASNFLPYARTASPVAPQSDNSAIGAGRARNLDPKLPLANSLEMLGR